MCISDWSSAVCSSELVGRGDLRPGRAIVARDVERSVVAAGPDDAGFDGRFTDRVERAVVLLARGADGDGMSRRRLVVGRVPRAVGREDRKSGGSGRSGAVRVVPGGGGIINKKK